MHLVADDLRGPEIAALLQAHLDSMHAISPPESIHALDLAALCGPDISFWTLWDGDRLAGCGALKALGEGEGEVKSMRTDTAYLRRGVAAQLLAHIIAVARERGITRLSLETGMQPPFVPAHRLYERFGFTRCGPFGAYRDDPNSGFFTLDL